MRMSKAHGFGKMVLQMLSLVEQMLDNLLFGILENLMMQVEMKILCSTIIIPKDGMTFLAPYY